MAQQRYSIIERLDSGGMAEVFKGRATSMRGFEKLVAIKRVLPELSRNKKFISMFLDEARLSLFLNHANVVHTFDIGVADDAYFIVMEWVEGVNLRRVIDVARARDFAVPREQAAFIAGEMCKGLSHAHRRCDPSGQPLHIVHRDINPPNVLLSRDGEVKLVDFGLAKAASQLSRTDPGVVKGKFRYLSPEGARGETVDARADIFSAGVVLWELLTGRDLFSGDTDLATVALVRKAEVPSLTAIDPAIEPELEAIVCKALAVDANDRYQSAEAFSHALARYLVNHRLLVTSFDIALLVQRVMRTPTASTAEPESSSWVDPTIQEELVEFTSLEDLERMPFRAVSETALPERIRIEANTEDPRFWAEELGFDKQTGDLNALLDKMGDLSGLRARTPQDSFGPAMTPAPDELGLGFDSPVHTPFAMEPERYESNAPHEQLADTLARLTPMPSAPQLAAFVERPSATQVMGGGPSSALSNTPSLLDTILAAQSDARAAASPPPMALGLMFGTLGVLAFGAAAWLLFA